MDRLPLISDGWGEALAEEQALYISLHIRSRLKPGIWCAWAVGERDELRLGVLEPEGEDFTLHRRFSRRSLTPLGGILRCEIRPAEEQQRWEQSVDPEKLFSREDLRRQLRGAAKIWKTVCAGRTLLAFPCDDGRPFPLPELFCLAHRGAIGERAVWIFAFEGDTPVL